MAKKRTKKVKESDYEVTVKDTSIGTQTPEKTTKVNAINPDQALDAAMDGQTSTGAEEVTVKKSDPTKAPPNPMAETKSYTIKGITEAAEYPYSISLPKQFGSFLEEAGLHPKEVGSSLMVTFANKKQLGEAVKFMKSDNSDKSKIVLNGIGRSVL